MSYHPVGQNFPGGWPGFPGGLPGPIQTHPGPAGPNVPASIFPTHTRQGDVVNIVGPFGGFGQGQVRVRFQGSGWLYPQIMGPTAASVVVPQDAETGLCEVELNGRRIFGTNCVIEKGQVRVGQKSHGRDTRAWNWAGGELVRVSGVGQDDEQPIRDLPAARFRTRMLLVAISAEFYEHYLKHEYFKGKSDLDAVAKYAKWGALGLALLSSIGVLHR